MLKLPHWLSSLVPGRKPSRALKRALLALSLTSVIAVSGCASNSQMPRCDALQVTVDPSLMEPPSYEATLLNSLSSKPSEQTHK